MSAALDAPREVRPGEELDAAKLREYLLARLGLEGELQIAQFPSGYSNLTYALRAGERELVLRRPPFGSKVKSAHDMGREYRVLSALQPVFPAAPRPLLYCEDSDIIGAPFYVMERIRGVILRKKPPEGAVYPPALAREACESLVRKLAELHAVDYEAIGLGDLRREGSYVARQVHGWVDRYRKSQTDDIPAMDDAARWMESHLPDDTASVLIHNDYKFDNVVFDAEDLATITGVLDWEMCTIGDPLMDLGSALAYWIEAGDSPAGDIACFLTRADGAYTRAEVAARYGEITGRDTSDIRFYFTFGLFKLAVIVQQIYYRYKHGLTKDERFAPLIFMVGALGMKANDVIETGRL